MIQDIAPSRLNNAYDSERSPNASDQVLHFTKDGVFVRRDHTSEAVFPKVSELSDTLIRRAKNPNSTLWFGGG